MITSETVIHEIKIIGNKIAAIVNSVIDAAKFWFLIASLIIYPINNDNGIETQIDVIIPALNELRSKDFNITNPLSADMVFSKAVNMYLKGEKQPYDCYISCYHDQGLIPIKCAGINRAVNMTIGLDIVRTSPCHGTAFDIAGKNIANPESMIEAIKQCLY